MTFKGITFPFRCHSQLVTLPDRRMYQEQHARDLSSPRLNSGIDYLKERDGSIISPCKSLLPCAQWIVGPETGSSGKEKLMIDVSRNPIEEKSRLSSVQRYPPTLDIPTHRMVDLSRLLVVY